MLIAHTHGRGVNHRQDSSTDPYPLPLHSGSRLRMGLVIVFLALGCLLAAPFASAQDVEQDYQRVSTQAFKELASKTPALAIDKKNINGLVRQALKADETGKSEQVIMLIAANMPVAQQNIRDKKIAELSRLLFTHQAAGLAEELLAMASRSGDDYAEARLRFEYARYLAARQQWPEAYAQLKSIDINNALLQAQSDEALIILGAALQHQKKHREAVEYFARLKPESEQYRIAQLNTAVAFIRQDWWTDAHIAVKNALKAGSTKDEMANRLYTLLGFSQLQHGFYRDARESFRHVHINSSYANRALLGLGVAALHQEDFVGALNAFNHLKNKDEHDISVAESYLLSAFSLVQLKQNRTASASYTEAITYYEQQAALYNSLSKNVATPAQLSPQQRHYLHTELQDHPTINALRTKRQNIEFLQSQPLSAATARAVNGLAAQLDHAYLTAVREVLEKKQTVIDSYLSQSRFGLARLFDTQ